TLRPGSLEQASLRPAAAGEPAESPGCCCSADWTHLVPRTQTLSGFCCCSHPGSHVLNSFMVSQLS
ncbi:hypothetical protein ILYODFUR_011438, partial [Ilyodon furcidens]